MFSLRWWNDGRSGNVVVGTRKDIIALYELLSSLERCYHFTVRDIYSGMGLNLNTKELCNPTGG